MQNKALITLGAGCFWCTEAVMQRLKGVETVVSGYAGGHTKHPSHREVGTGRTAHAEVVQVTFDSSEITFEDLVRIFMTSHDPTSLNHQGADKGTQYRSVIFYEDETQKTAIENVFEDIKDHFNSPIVTEIIPLQTFYPAETNHQNYYNKNPDAGYCSMVINPKLQKLKKMYAEKLKL
tara:strand:+ start:1492 stop:2025 length:534 start_codon:yes stop_codon:yes gene_type:complete